jgi:hypothetical protein
MKEIATHLTEYAQKALLMSTEERISYVQRPCWIEYTKAQEAIKKLEHLRTHPKVHRMPNVLLVADTNNGKTMIVNRFKELHPPCDNEEGEAIRYPVLVVQAPPAPDEGRLYNAILTEVGALYRERDRPDRKHYQVVEILSRIETKVLVIDEIHDLLAGTAKKQQQVLNVIKSLGNKLRISFVAVGTEKAFNVFQSDSQMMNRFEPVRLPKWNNNSMRGDFLTLLNEFKKTLPLWNPSNLYQQEEIVTKLLSMCEGLIGELSSVLSLACIEAIKRKHEQITLNTLKNINWTPPSKRRL